MVPGVRRSQFAAYTLATYVGAIWSAFNCLQSSMSYLEATTKLCNGVNLIIQGNFVVINTILLWKGMSKLLFGELRLLEYEHIFERLSFTLVSSFFMTSTYSDNEFLSVLVFEGALIFVKVFHWVLKDRLEYVMQNTDENTRLVRFVFSKFVFNICFLAWLDCKVVLFCYRKLMRQGLSIFNGSTLYVLFGTKFAMLFIDVLEVALKTVINAVELHQVQRAQAHNEDEGVGLEGKFIYEKFAELFCRCAKGCLHSLLLIPFSMPIMVMKDIVLDLLAVYQTSHLIWKTLKSNRQIDEKLPTVTEAELNSHDERMCIVCMDDMLPADQVTHPRLKPKRLPCNHTLHLGCLKSWMERSQTCPICRVPVFDEKGNVAQATNTSNTQSQNSTRPGANSPTPTHVADSVSSRNATNVLPTAYSSATAGPLRWYAFPTISSQRPDVKKIQISDSNGVTRTLTITHTMRPEFVAQEESPQTPEKVVIKNSSIESSYEIDRMKRRISDLECKVEELKKKARTE
ncbi:LAME_0D10044g1_1 [Lachancea meyersii CBS 8951]|uniref:RING-type E3 ubiquitin transferase n=1 Tax=Lachancea meyersii CBS 8951 TaxID=1266667 RepID=A0A1G4JBF3_9SACH|nr:LAME_0D10044g1_1 [Lachancea meyersii CBS 8951]